MGILVYSLLWVMQDLYDQQYQAHLLLSHNSDSALPNLAQTMRGRCTSTIHLSFLQESVSTQRFKLGVPRSHAGADLRSWSRLRIALHSGNSGPSMQAQRRPTTHTSQQAPSRHTRHRRPLATSRTTPATPRRTPPATGPPTSRWQLQSLIAAWPIKPPPLALLPHS